MPLWTSCQGAQNQDYSVPLKPCDPNRASLFSTNDFWSRDLNISQPHVIAMDWKASSFLLLSVNEYIEYGSSTHICPESQLFSYKRHKEAIWLWVFPHAWWLPGLRSQNSTLSWTLQKVRHKVYELQISWGASLRGDPSSSWPVRYMPAGRNFSTSGILVK